MFITRKIVMVLIILVVAMVCGTLLVAASPATTIVVDGKVLQTEVPAVIMNGRTMVPLRGIFEALGVNPQWDASTRTVTANSDAVSISLIIDSRIAVINGNPVPLDVPGTIVDGRTLVPTRFIAESLGAEVEWLPESRTVVVKSKGYQNHGFQLTDAQKRALSIHRSEPTEVQPVMTVPTISASEVAAYKEEAIQGLTNRILNPVKSNLRNLRDAINVINRERDNHLKNVISQVEDQISLINANEDKEAKLIEADAIRRGMYGQGPTDAILKRNWEYHQSLREKVWEQGRSISDDINRWAESQLYPLYEKEREIENYINEFEALLRRIKDSNSIDEVNRVMQQFVE